LHALGSESPRKLVLSERRAQQVAGLFQALADDISGLSGSTYRCHLAGFLSESFTSSVL
jgi:hypothetical protein